MSCTPGIVNTEAYIGSNQDNVGIRHQVQSTINHIAPA